MVITIGSISSIRLIVIIAFLLSPIGNAIYANAQLSGVTGAVNNTVSGVTGTAGSTVSGIGSNLTDILFNNGTLITTVNGILMTFQLDPYQPLASSTVPVSYAVPQGTGTGDPTTVALNDPQTTFGTVSSAPYQFTISNFNPGTGSNNLLVVGVSANNQYATSVTFGGTPLTKAVSSFANNDAEFWYLANPTGTGNIVVTMNGATSAVIGAYAFSGVNQASPIAGTATNFNPLGTPSSPSVSITTKYANDQVVDLPSIYGGQLLGSPTCAQQWDTNIPSAITGASSIAMVSSPGTVTCKWTASNGGDQWDDVAIEIKSSGTTTVTPPSAPTNPAATGGNAQVSLSWNAPSNNGGSPITNYKIYRSTTAGAETLLTTVGNVNSYTDSGLANGVTYFYKVSAVNSAGESSLSSEASATPASITTVTPPSAPTNPAATGGNAQVSLSWNAPSNNGGSPITNYKIYRSTTAGAETLLTTVGNVNSYTDSGLANGVTYFYKVSAVNSVGESAKSAEASATPSAPAPPPGQATISVNSADLCGNPITGLWTIVRYTNGNEVTEGYTPATFTLASGTTYVVHVGNYGSDVFDHWMDGSTTSYYTITLTQNTVLTAYYSTGSTCTPPPNSTPPGAPTGLTATAASSSQVSLSWTTPSNNGGSPITNYKIYRSTTAGAETLLTTVGNVNSYTDSGLTSGQPYFYEVTAVNAIGESVRSNEAGATPPLPSPTPPSAPTGLTATDGNGQASLSWTTPSSNGGSPITNYKIYRSTTAGAETLLTTVGNVNSYTDSGLANGVTYFYKVSAVNSVGESAKSAEASVTDAGSPPPPTGLAVTAVSQSQINLSWTAPSSNGGSAITGYKIERSPDNTNWSAIATNTGSTTYSDSGLAASTTYYYRVSAINSVGTSQPSSTASAMTQAAPTFTISQTQSGKVASDSLTNETESRSQLLSSSGYWRYQGDAQAEGAPFSVTRDSQGLHIGLQAQSDGRWAGFFAESPNHNAQVWHSVISTNVRSTPSRYYDNGLYVQTSNGNINYVTCGSLTNSQATIWVVISATGNTQEVTQFNRLWEDNSPNQSLTRDCTIITNGSNSLKVYLDGTLVYQNNSLSLQMPAPFNAYLEGETSYAGGMLTDTFQNYYVTANQYVTVSNLPSSTSSVAITNPSGTVLATSPDSGGTATLDIGKYTLPISGTLKVYGSSNSQLATSSGAIYGGDMYKIN